MSNFPTDRSSIDRRIDAIDPIDYARTRNFVDGGVTLLSPYISRGVISTNYVLQRVLERGYDRRRITKFIQELAWREYYQRVWQALGDDILDDVRQPQEHVADHLMPRAVVDATTGIDGIDAEIERLYSTGYMHNHARMYTAALCCNIAKSHWRLPSKWMYFHLLDGDIASNTLSWQWIAGTFSSKRYVADQQNVNRFTHTHQTGTFLDRSYDELLSGATPQELSRKAAPDLSCVLPSVRETTIDRSKPTVVYTSYNLDATWRKEIDANRVLLLEPSHFERFPVSKKVLGFILQVAENIDELPVFVGEFDELADRCGHEIIYREHPLANHFTGTKDDREWMFETSGYFRSFSAYWKHCERELADRDRGLFATL